MSRLLISRFPFFNYKKIKLKQVSAEANFDVKKTMSEIIEKCVVKIT